MLNSQNLDYVPVGSASHLLKAVRLLTMQGHNMLALGAGTVKSNLDWGLLLQPNASILRHGDVGDRGVEGCEDSCPTWQM